MKNIKHMPENIWSNHPITTTYLFTWNYFLLIYNEGGQNILNISISNICRHTMMHTNHRQYRHVRWPLHRSFGVLEYIFGWVCGGVVNLIIFSTPSQVEVELAWGCGRAVTITCNPALPFNKTIYIYSWNSSSSSSSSSSCDYNTTHLWLNYI
jgi:hypothetical protein